LSFYERTRKVIPGVLDIDAPPEGMPSLQLPEKFEIQVNQVIPRNVVKRTKIIGHLGIWQLIGIQQFGIGWGKYDVTIEKGVYELRGFRTKFIIGDKIGVAIEPQFTWAESEGPRYIGDRDQRVFENTLNPYDVPSLNLPDEPLGGPLALGSIFERWLSP